MQLPSVQILASGSAEKSCRSLWLGMFRLLQKAFCKRKLEETVLDPRCFLVALHTVTSERHWQYWLLIDLSPFSELESQSIFLDVFHSKLSGALVLELLPRLLRYSSLLGRFRKSLSWGSTEEAEDDLLIC